MDNRFSKFLKVVEKNEGGYANDPDDAGGRTYRGISQKFWPKWRGWELLKKHEPLKYNQIVDDAELEKAIEEFYYEQFWKPTKANDINEDSLALQYFDFAVNSGTRQSAKTLQKAVGAAVDGIVGPKTIAAANSGNFSNKFLEERKNFYKLIGTGTNEKFLPGWLKRAESVAKYK